MLEFVRLKFQWNWATPGKSLRRTIFLKSGFKFTNKGKPPRMFSLTCILTNNDVEFLPIEISSKKVRANNVYFSTIKISLKKIHANNVNFFTIKIMSTKVSGNNVDFSNIEITSKKVRRNDVDFSISKITLKKYVEMTWKFVKIWSSSYRHNIDIESTSI